MEAAAIELAATRTPGQCKPMIDRRVIAADPDAARKRTEAARAERCVVREAGEDGMGMIKAILPAEGAVSVYELLDSIARATAGQDDRPMGARRADALIDICVSLLTDGHVEVTPLRAGHPNDNYPGHGAEPANEAPLDQGEPGTSQPENEAAAGHERHDGPAVQAFAENGEPNRTGDVSVASPADAIVSGPREAERLSSAVLESRDEPPWPVRSPECDDVRDHPGRVRRPPRNPGRPRCYHRRRSQDDCQLDRFLDRHRRQ